jgi:hypothetical protein
MNLALWIVTGLLAAVQGVGKSLLRTHRHRERGDE